MILYKACLNPVKITEVIAVSILSNDNYHYISKTGLQNRKGKDFFIFTDRETAVEWIKDNLTIKLDNLKNQYLDAKNELDNFLNYEIDQANNYNNEVEHE